LLTDIIDTSSPLATHLEDLRTKLMLPLIFNLSLILLIMNFTEKIMANLLLIVNLELTNLTTYSPTELIKMKLYISLVGSFVISSPIWFSGFYKFSRPGLTRKESNGLLVMFAMGSLLFLVGFITGLYYIAPLVIDLFINNDNLVVAHLSIYETIKLVISIALFTGFLICLPTLVLISTDYQNNIEEIRKYMYFIIIIIVMIATPQPSLIVNLFFMILFVIVAEMSLLISGGKLEN